MSARMDRLEFYREVVDLGSGYVPGDWRWRYVAANGHILAVSSEGYRRRIDAVRCAARVLGINADTLADLVRNAPAEVYRGAGPVAYLRVVVKP